MTSLPLFYYPSTLVMVDDDELILKSLKNAFQQENKILAFQSSKEAQVYFEKYQSSFLPQNFLRCEVEDERHGMLQYSLVDFDVTQLATIANDAKRFDEISVMVIDYHMPEMTGFSLAEKISNKQIKKILLTGEAEPSDAVLGFNDNLIDRYVRKGDLDMFEKLTEYLKQLSFEYFRLKTGALLSHLEADGLTALTDPVFVEFFKKYCIDNKIKEYYLIDKQGSYLCIDEFGNQSYLIVHTDRSLDAWIELYQDESPLITLELAAVQLRKKIPFFGIGKEIWELEVEEWSKYFYPAQILDGRKRYYWTVTQS